jgi:hypothetical protein
MDSPIKEQFMAYVTGNPKSKAELKRWLKEGKLLTVYAPGLGEQPENGTVYLEGPHYPKPHSWYGVGTVRDGVLVKVN